jgi:cytoskeletal protein RodZ
MAQHNIDKDFKSKLSQREITPTANAWDRLDAMLTVAEQKKPKKDFGWLYIAASVVGFLLIGTVYFNNIPELKDVKREGNNEIVLQNNESEKTPETTTTEILPTVTDSQSIASVTPTKTKSPVQSNSVSIITQTAGNQKTNNQNHSNPVQTINEVTNQSQLIAENKPSSIKTGPIGTNQSVDELLANAGAAQPSSTQSSVKVNAKNLLSQVDGEVNQTFREKIIHKIGRNYQEVAQAVSTRNIQQ